jgi:hypothetical protein
MDNVQKHNICIKFEVQNIFSRDTKSLLYNIEIFSNLLFCFINIKYSISIFLCHS